MGYGRKPQVALFWIGIVVLLGCFVFRKKGMEPRKPDSIASDHHTPWYSLDAFVPVIELQIADDLVPKQARWFALQYLYVHRFLGWVLTGWLLIPIGVAAVTGTIK